MVDALAASFNDPSGSEPRTRISGLSAAVRHLLHRNGPTQRRAGLGPVEPATRQNPETPVHILKVRPWLAALEDYQLLPEAKIVCDQQRLWSDSRSKRPQQTAKH
jgi:hypothetical protein